MQPRPAGVPELKFRDFYRTPLGPRGIELTEVIHELEGQTVCVVGYMVQSTHLTPGTFLLTPRPVKMDDCHYGLADDLPPQTLQVTVPALAGRKARYQPGLVSVVGKLELGPKEQPDGRNCAVRLVMEEQGGEDPPPARSNLQRPSTTEPCESKPADHPSHFHS
jgi:hypothetical protein